jgi:hypothetical protein
MGSSLVIAAGMPAVGMRKLIPKATSGWHDIMKSMISPGVYGRSGVLSIFGFHFFSDVSVNKG